MALTMDQALNGIENEQKFEIAYSIATVVDTTAAYMDALAYMPMAKSQAITDSIFSLNEKMKDVISELKKNPNSKNQIQQIQLVLRYLDAIGSIQNFTAVITSHPKRQKIERTLNDVIKDIYSITNAVCNEQDLETLKSKLALNFKLLSDTLSAVLHADTKMEVEQYVTEQNYEVATIQYRPRPSISKLKKSDWIKLINDLDFYDYDTQHYLMERFLKKYLNEDLYCYQVGYLKEMMAKYVYLNQDLKEKVEQVPIELVHILSPSDKNKQYPFFPFKLKSSLEVLEMLIQDTFDIEHPIERLFHQKRIFDVADVLEGLFPANYKMQFAPYLAFKQEYFAFIESLNDAIGILEGTLGNFPTITVERLEIPIYFKGEMILLETLLAESKYMNVAETRYTRRGSVKHYKHTTEQLIQSVEKSREQIEYYRENGKLDMWGTFDSNQKLRDYEALKLSVMHFLKENYPQVYQKTYTKYHMEKRVLEWLSMVPSKYYLMKSDFYRDMLVAQIAANIGTDDIVSILSSNKTNEVHYSLMEHLANALVTHQNGLQIIYHDIEMQHAKDNGDIAKTMYTQMKKRVSIYNYKVMLVVFAKYLPLQMKAYCQYFVPAFNGDLSDSGMIEVLKTLGNSYYSSDKPFNEVYKASRKLLIQKFENE